MMNYLLLILLITVLIGMVILLRDVYHLKSSFARFRKQIAEKGKDDYVFLINQDLMVKATNYYDINPEMKNDEQPPVLGNILRCKQGCDSGMCGTGFACQTCPVRFVLINSFKNKRDFENVEASMDLYDADRQVYSVDVLVGGELVYACARPYLMVSVSSSTEATLRSFSAVSDTLSTRQ